MKINYIVVQIDDYSGVALEFSEENLKLAETLIPVNINTNWGEPVKPSCKQAKEYPIYLTEKLAREEKE